MQSLSVLRSLADRMSVIAATTPDKMNDLYSVTLGQSRLTPLVTTDYQMVKLDGDSCGGQGQFSDEIV